MLHDALYRAARYAEAKAEQRGKQCRCLPSIEERIRAGLSDHFTG